MTDKPKETQNDQDRPKRWTWEEWYKQVVEVGNANYPIPGPIPKWQYAAANKAIRANDPYIDYLEKRVEELGNYIAVIDKSIEMHNQTERIEELEKHIEELKRENTEWVNGFEYHVHKNMELEKALREILKAKKYLDSEQEEWVFENLLNTVVELAAAALGEGG